MKKILIAIFAFFFSFGLSQDYKILIQKAKFREKIGSYWTEWSSLKNTNLEMEINSVSKRITFYSDPKKVYNVVDFKFSKETDDSSSRDYICIDSSKKQYVISFVENLKNEISVHIIDNNFEYMYFGVKD